MRVLIRSSVVGNEYWDTEEKQTILLPHGKKPDFEVSVNPESLVTPEDKKPAIEVEPVEVEKPVIDDEMNLEEMTIKELRSFAKKQGVDIPGAIRTKDDIIAYLSES